MKKSMLILAGVVITTGALLVSCNTPAEKVQNAREDVTAAKVALDKAQQEYMEDLTNYRKATAEKIAENEKIAADFRVKIVNEKKDAKAAYEAKLAELEKKNTELKNKIDSYQSSNKDSWQAFKVEFNRDMDELGIAFKNLTVNSTK